VGTRMTPAELDALPNNTVILRNEEEPFIANKFGRYGGPARFWIYNGSSVFRSEWISQGNIRILWQPSA